MPSDDTSYSYKRSQRCAGLEAALEVALGRATRPRPSALRLYAGLALLLPVLLGERLLAAVRAGLLWLVLRLARVRWDRLDRGTVSPLVRAGLCVGFFVAMLL